MPAAAGSIVTMKMLSIESATGRCMSEVIPIKISRAALTNSGMVKMVIMLLTDVRETDRATFPLKIYVTNPDVVPPGHEASMMNPTFMAGERGEKYMTAMAIRGSRIICATSPPSSDRGE